MLGVIIGVTSVIVMIAIVQGIRQQIFDQFSGNGANLIFISYQPKIGTVSRGGFAGLTMADARVGRGESHTGQLRQPGCPDLRRRAGGQQSPFGHFERRSGHFQPDPEPAAGQSVVFSAADDVANWGKACVIGHKIRQDLFGDADPLGREIHCTTDDGSDVSLVVVGRSGGKRLQPRRRRLQQFPLCRLDDRAEAIHRRATRSTGSRPAPHEISQVETAADQVWGILKQRHPLNYKDFVVDTQEGILKQLDTLLGGIQLALGGVGGLALLTGGIGIMNIMLVSVTERTREIGIRKAVGATRGAILLQFVVEAMVVSGLGGLIGVAGGYGLSALINHFAHKTLPTYVPFWATELGFGFAVGVGLFFGIYPAFRAAKLDPITALRYE